MGHPIMANAKTKEFEIYVEVNADTTADNQTLDMTDYVDIADNQAFEVHECDIVLDPTVDMTGFATDGEFIFQLADSNIQAFVSHADRTSLFICRQSYPQTLQMFEQTSFPTLVPLIVSKTLWLRNESYGLNNIAFTLRIRGRIDSPSAKDYMALVLTQTGNVA